VACESQGNRREQASPVVADGIWFDDTFTALLLGLGAASLLVRGVGIANVMVIAVLERRGEIGLKGALRATRTPRRQPVPGRGAATGGHGRHQRQPRGCRRHRHPCQHQRMGDSRAACSPDRRYRCRVADRWRGRPLPGGQSRSSVARRGAAYHLVTYGGGGKETPLDNAMPRSTTRSPQPDSG